MSTLESSYMRLQLLYRMRSAVEMIRDDDRACSASNAIILIVFFQPRANYQEEMMKPYRRKVIGEIDGIRVFGQYYDDDGKPSVVLMQWKSWEIETDGVALWFP